ncbi:MAG: flagellar hook-associated protein FlgL [Pseudomonadales bacterium]|jgi:flagellar hook-associated protein 3 FlgL|nr:flagellar hook-associated protein FlgL [Pseudomonadales bacterium]
MRISTSLVFERGKNALVDQQSALSEQQLRLASGKRYLSPSEDPSAAVQSLSLTRAIEATQQFVRNGQMAESRLMSQETVLATVNENIQRVRELTLQAANASQTDSTRGDIAAEIAQRLDELVDLANTRDANGEYVFAGFQSAQRPFTRVAGGVQYNGDAGERYLAVSPERQVRVGDSGRRLFMELPGGNGTFAVAPAAGNSGGGIIETGSVTDSAAWTGQDYSIEFTAPDRFTVRDGAGAVVAADVPYVSDASVTAIPGIEFVIEGAPAAGDRFSISPARDQSLFATYDELLAALRTPAESTASGARLQSTVNRVLTALDGASTAIVDARADTGARLRSVESQRAINEDLILNYERTRSAVDDLDYTAAISEFQQQLTAFQAAQASFARIQGLSLFDFIR